MKVCPVVVSGGRLLAFRHPLAGCQLVKGGLEAGETAAEGAVRELREESGLAGEWVRSLGEWESGWEGQTWCFELVRVEALGREGWRHWTEDGGGLEFEFFWVERGAELAEGEWHPVYRRAVAEIWGRLGG